MRLYPLKFRPRFVEKMWGGRKLSSVLGKPLPSDKPFGESWELFDFPPGVVEPSDQWVSSEIANGPLAGRSLHWTMGEFGADLYGRAALSGRHGQFPILIKFLDAREDLSVQVHPDHAYASANPHTHLKTEAWYVLQSDSGSRLLMGLKPGATRDKFEKAIGRGDVEGLIESIPAREGECFYLPSGTVHALGAGLLVAEVQTPSDTTFRVFDFNRIDPSTGARRKLHVAEALQCIDFSTPASERTGTGDDEKLVSSPYFHLERMQLAKGAEQQIGGGEPVVLIAARGSFELRSAGEHQPVHAGLGEVVLLPANLKQTQVHSQSGCTFLKVTFPQEQIP